MRKWQIFDDRMQHVMEPVSLEEALKWTTEKLNRDNACPEEYGVGTDPDEPSNDYDGPIRVGYYEKVLKGGRLDSRFLLKPVETKPPRLARIKTGPFLS